MQITDKMREEIKLAVQDLEKSTSGEMVCVIAQSSAQYVLFPLLWASFAALLLPVLNPLLLLAGQHAVVTFPIQSLVFIALAAAFLAGPLRVQVTPQIILDHNCRRVALEQFYAQTLHDTQRRTGVLLFVSVLEHHVEIIADAGIHDKMKDGEWDAIIGALTTAIREGRVQEGFVAAIGACKKVMHKHFPEVRGKVNELDDHLVEIPEAHYIN